MTAPETDAAPLSSAVSALLGAADHAVSALGSLYAAAHYVRELNPSGASTGELDTLRNDLEDLGTRALEQLRPLALELAREWEGSGEAGSALRLRWKLAHLEDNLDTDPRTPHPVPADAVHVTPDGYAVTPHGAVYPEGVTFSAEPDGAGYTLRIHAEDTGSVWASYTVPAHVLALLELLRPVGGSRGQFPHRPAPPLRPLILSAERDGNGGVLFWAADRKLFHVSPAAGYAVPSVPGGLPTVTAYQFGETGDPEAPSEVTERLTAYLMPDALGQLEQLEPERVINGERREYTPAALSLLARRKAWGGAGAAPLN